MAFILFYFDFFFNEITIKLRDPPTKVDRDKGGIN